jgi:hypothetical protein
MNDTLYFVSPLLRKAQITSTLSPTAISACTAMPPANPLEDKCPAVGAKCQERTLLQVCPPGGGGVCMLACLPAGGGWVTMTKPVDTSGAAAGMLVSAW